jgi:hypothetical protein
MVSATVPRRRTRPAHQLRRSSWPASPIWRNALRLFCAVPFLLIALRASTGGYLDQSNRALIKQGDLIHWGSNDLSFVNHVYPPIPAVIAAIIPSSVGLAIAGSLAAGVLVEALGYRLGSSRMPLPLVLLLIATFACSPSFALAATSDLRSFLALTLLAISLEGFIRFAFRGQTHGGFQAGLALGLAALCEPASVVCALGFAAAAPLIAQARFRGQRHAGRATAAVLLFPTVAGLLGWTFLCWRFGNSPLGWLHHFAPGLGFGHGTWTQLVTAARGVSRAMIFTPVYLLAILIMIARGRYLPALGTLFPAGCVLIAVWVGLPVSPLWVAAVFGIIGLISLPRWPSTTMSWIIAATAIGGLVLKWSLSTNATVIHWQNIVLR